MNHCRTAVLAGFFLVLGGCGKPNQPAPDPLLGGGSTFLAPVMKKWAVEYRKGKNVQLDCRALGSAAGFQEMLDGSLDFATTDLPLTEDQVMAAKDRGGVIVVPLALGGIVPAYNLPNLDQPLRFSGPLLAEIFLGNVTKWNDKSIQALNPGANLPDQAITVGLPSRPQRQHAAIHRLLVQG
jgi:ABC-type phosphate transport system substrate-binding protein